MYITKLSTQNIPTLCVNTCMNIYTIDYIEEKFSMVKSLNSSGVEAP